ncbi:MAG: IMP dehydrogenase, partial [Erysipelotrichaceae bacterium]|nr:IMP dehydrogenase [Erysipelotrichaceae bacterium]
MDTLHGKVIKEGYTFDDLLLVPSFSQVVPAKVVLSTRLTSKIMLKIPVVSAAMDTVTEDRMAIALAKAGGLGFIHKNLSVELQAQMVRNVKEAALDLMQDAAVDGNGRLLVGAAVGVGEKNIERVKALVEAGVDIIAVDSAHG